MFLVILITTFFYIYYYYPKLTLSMILRFPYFNKLSKTIDQNGIHESQPLSNFCRQIINGKFFLKFLHKKKCFLYIIFQYNISLTKKSAIKIFKIRFPLKRSTLDLIETLHIQIFIRHCFLFDVIFTVNFFCVLACIKEMESYFL